VRGLRALAIGGFVLISTALAWLLFVGLPHWYRVPGAERAVAATPSAPAPAPPGRRIKARLYYVAPDGTHLQPIERDVPYGEGTADQAKLIMEAQLLPAAEPLVSAVPPGTRLRAVFVTNRGEAFVDLSREISAHGRGTVDELLAVYTIVDALTTNLPSVTAVQLLVDGRQVDTLAGHIDLRRPLVRNLAWVQ
jgi:spore germination protein GerM